MKIGQMLKESQPDIHKRLNKDHKKKKRDKGNLSFEEVMQLMKHDSYYRGRGGAIKQR